MFTLFLCQETEEEVTDTEQAENWFSLTSAQRICGQCSEFLNFEADPCHVLFTAFLLPSFHWSCLSITSGIWEWERGDIQNRIHTYYV